MRSKLKELGVETIFVAAPVSERHYNATAGGDDRMLKVKKGSSFQREHFVFPRRPKRACHKVKIDGGYHKDSKVRGQGLGDAFPA